MLRHLRIKNFVQFEKEQKLDFVNGSHFFIGPNNSGKSSVFEAIRRCLSISKNTSLSSSQNITEPSVVVCIYELKEKQRKVDGALDEKDEENKQQKGDNNDVNRKEEAKETCNTVKEKLITSIICLPKKSRRDVSVYVKVVMYFGHECYKFGMEFVKENRHEVIVNESITVHDTEKKWYELGQNMLNRNDTDSNDAFDRFVDKVVNKRKVQNRHYEFSKEDVLVDNTTPCEQILHDYLDNHVVFTMSMRSLGPLQWSFSKRVSPKYKDENYRNARKRAEIVTWYLSWCKTTESENPCVLREIKYFDRITNKSGFEFTYGDGDELKVYTKHGRHQSIPILKVPEGIMEAKTCSILLAVDCFSTVGLEDPEKGMHPQMVERLRDLVLWEIKNKVVLLTTHHPSFLAPWTISRICLFRHNELTNTSNIISGKRISEPLLTERKVLDFPAEKLEETNIIPHTLRTITGYHFSSIFFAEKVMLVEGDTDFLFMSTLRMLLLMENEEKSDFKLIFEENMKPDEIEDFKRFMASLQIMEIHGEGNKDKFENICKNLEIERYFLFDIDAIKSKKDQKTPFSENFELKYTQEKIMENVQVLENEGIFVWKNGNIEQEFVKLSNDHDMKHQQGKCDITNCLDMKTCLQQNKVNFKLDKSKKKIKSIKKKLFADKSLTEQHMKNLITNVLVISRVETDSEFVRFVNFLYKIAKKRYGLRFNRQL